ncbi:MoxR family ATPase [Halogeometricum sp. CBA1124]|uniref:AAA family ATPase n=1 Tax=Halogeometricum sp. CBA1124 TaxID=2668071 RepID=UPI00142C7C8A|nr:MoxR family ATPase [Halogeometricum sp. CBA1124]MUV57101.1 AAA domain-containing protein [Halogeometricum sp. CBA1124]
MTDVDPEWVHEQIQSEVATVIVGNDEVVERLLITFLTRGHALLEGVPGVAKTSIANAFARTTGLGYNRIQMTPDLLPADITGTHIYRDATGEFELQRGPVFSNVVLADEINRATPKTQSALLEAMQEGQVTIEGDTLSLPSPFMLIATQNPLEMEGVFELPEAQRDRFQLKLTVDLPSSAEEQRLLDRFDANPELTPESLEQVVTTEDLLAAREYVDGVYVDQKIKDYILSIVAATRESDAVEFGASPRAALTYMNVSKARAAIRGRDYVIPDDVNDLAQPTLAHRLVVSADADLRGRTTEDLVAEILDAVDAPGGSSSPPPSQRTDGESGESRPPSDDR